MMRAHSSHSTVIARLDAGTQYAAASRFERQASRRTGSPAFAGIDEVWVAVRFARDDLRNI